MTKVKQNTEFKEKIRETLVINYYVELKDDALTKERYFDLVQVPELYVSGAGTFIWKLRREKGLSQQKFAKLFNVTRSRVNHWERNDRRIPLQLLVKIVKAHGISKETIYELIDQGEFTTNSELPVQFEQIRDIIPYLSPHKTNQDWEITVIQCADEILRKIKSSLNVNIKTFPYGKRINSKELYTFLTTFFHYTEVPKIKPPLTEEVKLWHEKGVDLKRAVIIPCLQSDGSMNHEPPSLRFIGNSEILHDYFVDAMYYTYNELPSSYLWNDGSKDCYVTSYRKNSIKEIIAEVMKLAGNTKTQPAKGQPVEEYLQEPQPHLNYLMNAPKKEQQIALQVWAVTEGCVSVALRTDGYIRPIVAISSAHPDLVRQIKKLAQRFNIYMAKNNTKDSCSGVLGLRTSGLSAAINFLKLGGFIKGVKISSINITKVLTRMFFFLVF
jgi:transcriptional regulator with XRE-family HTH domain